MVVCQCRCQSGQRENFSKQEMFLPGHAPRAAVPMVSELPPGELRSLRLFSEPPKIKSLQTL